MWLPQQDRCLAQSPAQEVQDRKESRELRGPPRRAILGGREVGEWEWWSQALWPPHLSKLKEPHHIGVINSIMDHYLIPCCPGSVLGSSSERQQGSEGVRKHKN